MWGRMSAKALGTGEKAGRAGAKASSSIGVTRRYAAVRGRIGPVKATQAITTEGQVGYPHYALSTRSSSSGSGSSRSRSSSSSSTPWKA